MFNFIQRAARAICRRVDLSDNGRVRRIMNHPPTVEDNSIVFTSSVDFSGNPKALFLYMIEHGYNERYHITWLFERKENFFKFDIPNVSSEIIWNSKGIRRPAAQKAAMSAKYLFFSHNMNWVRKYNPEQSFINLWHGCGYKDDLKSDKRKIYYDYLIVTGKKYIDIFRRVLKDPGGIILDLGYPRNERLFSEMTNSKRVLDEMKRDSDADKVVIWMPTYRASVLERLNTDTAVGSTGLPILHEESEIRELNAWCRDRGLLIVLKQHFLQKDYNVSAESLSNIIFVDDQYFSKREADFYEFLGCTDALITDYSSVAVDYMLLNRPIAYTLDDYERYDKARGFSFEGVKDYMPGHHIYTLEDLKTFLDDIADGRDIYAERREKIRPEMQSYTEGWSKRILDYFGI